jgi:hypothetical protein
MGGLKKYSLILLMALFVAVHAESTYHKDHLVNNGMGARPLAMGKAYTAVDGDVNAMLYNPAGTAGIAKFQVMGLNSQRLIDVNEYAFLGAYPLLGRPLKGVVGFGYLELSVPDILLAAESLDASGHAMVGGKANYRERLYLINYAEHINRQHSWGVNFKYYHNDLDTSVAKVYGDYRADGSDMDIGYMYRPRQDLTFGATYHNAFGRIRWTTGTEEKIMNTFRLGAAYRWRYEDIPVLHTVDYEIPAQGPNLWHVGNEVRFYNSFALRFGFNQRIWAETTKFSSIVGVGLNYAGLDFDYTYYPDSGERNDPKHFFSIRYNFELEKPKIDMGQQQSNPNVEEKIIHQESAPAAVGNPAPTVYDEQRDDYIEQYVVY